MSELRVRNVEEWVIEQLRIQAKQSGVSMESHIRAKLSDIALAPRKEMVQRARERLERLREKYGVMEDSSQWIREDRETRG